jgi:hypothetical protein
MKFIDYNNPINGEFLFLGWKVGGNTWLFYLIKNDYPIWGHKKMLQTLMNCSEDQL